MLPADEESDTAASIGGSEVVVVVVDEDEDDGGVWVGYDTLTVAWRTKTPCGRPESESTLIENPPLAAAVERLGDSKDARRRCCAIASFRRILRS